MSQESLGIFETLLVSIWINISVFCSAPFKETLKVNEPQTESALIVKVCCMFSCYSIKFVFTFHFLRFL